MKLLDYWLKASACRVGIAIQTNDRVLLRQQLYNARKEAGDPLLDELVIIMPVQEDELYIVKRNP